MNQAGRNGSSGERTVEIWKSQPSDSQIPTAPAATISRPTYNNQIEPKCYLCPRFDLLPISQSAHLGARGLIYTAWNRLKRVFMSLGER